MERRNGRSHCCCAVGIMASEEKMMFYGAFVEVEGAVFEMDKDTSEGIGLGSNCLKLVGMLKLKDAFSHVSIL